MAQNESTYLHASLLGFSRRQFIHTAGIAAAALGGDCIAAPDRPAQETAPPAEPPRSPLPLSHTDTEQIPHKPLGKTGVSVSILAMGGHHLGDATSVDVAVQMVQDAVEAWITFFDNGWEYHNGKSEDWLGQ